MDNEAPNVYADAKPLEVTTDIPDTIKAIVERVDIAIDAADELVVTRLEAKFATTKLELIQLEEKLKGFSTEFNTLLQEMVTKYSITPGKHAFDLTSKTWKAL